MILVISKKMNTVDKFNSREEMERSFIDFEIDPVEYELQIIETKDIKRIVIESIWDEDQVFTNYDDMLEELNEMVGVDQTELILSNMMDEYEVSYE